MGASDIAAWVGAITGLLALGLEFWASFRSGPRLKVNARGGWKILKDEHFNKKYIMLDASNVGDRGTTILHVVCYKFTSYWKYLIRKPSGAYYVKEPGELFGERLPFKLDAGCIWNGALEQSDDIEKAIKSGYVRALIYCVDGNKSAKITIQDNPSEES